MLLNRDLVSRIEGFLLVINSIRFHFEMLFNWFCVYFRDLNS